jgi:hypothetical protein
MRIILTILLFAALSVLAPATARAGAPSIPNITTSSTWSPVTVSTTIPAAPAVTPQFVPFSTSAPYTNWIPCVGNVVTAFALDFCGSVVPVQGIVAGVNLGFAGASGGGACVSFTGGPCVTLCADGLFSSSTGSGTCSDHGGEAALHGLTGP